MKKTGFEMIMKLKDVDQIFDLVCSANWFRGSLDGDIPVEESREAFRRIKTLILTRQRREIAEKLKKIKRDGSEWGWKNDLNKLITDLEMES